MSDSEVRLPASGPIRMCLGCRTRAPRGDLLRVVARLFSDRPVLEVDVRACLPGRGAWVHPTHDCVQAVAGRGGWSRALRFAGVLDAQTLVNYVSSGVASSSGD